MAIVRGAESSNEENGSVHNRNTIQVLIVVRINKFPFCLKYKINERIPILSD